MSRRRTALAVIAAAGATWFALRATPRDGARSEGAPSLAVTGKGFALIRATGGGAHAMTELAPDGRVQREVSVDGLSADVRVVGTRALPALFWLDGQRRLRFALVDGQGRRHDEAILDHELRGMCDGLASNDQRFAIGVINRHGTVWFWHGATAASAQASEIAGAATWCAVASAGPDVALFWREGGRLYINHCNAKRCGSSHPVERSVGTRPVLGVGCVRETCLLITRPDAGALEASLLHRGGAVKWSRRLSGAPDGGAVAVVGAGRDHLAVAYGVTAGGGRHVEVVTLDQAGAVTPLWRSPAETAATAPALAWSKGRLAIAWRDHAGDATTVRTATVALP